MTETIAAPDRFVSADPLFELTSFLFASDWTNWEALSSLTVIPVVTSCPDTVIEEAATLEAITPYRTRRPAPFTVMLEPNVVMLF